MGRTTTTFARPYPADWRLAEAAAREDGVPLANGFAPVFAPVLAAVLAVALGLSTPAAAQFGQRSVVATGVAPVTVDDSPSALLLIQRATDQALPNPPDAVRALQEVLDELGDKLVPVDPVDDDQSDRLVSARQAAHTVLRRHPTLLERYRRVEDARAEALLERGELERLWRTRMLTEPGLRGGLLLAETAIERAQFALATALLAEIAAHPILGPGATDDADRRDASVQLERLRGMVASATGDLEAAIGALDRLDAARTPLSVAAATSLRRMIDSEPVVPRVGHGVLDAGVAPPSEPTSWHLIARVPMPASLHARLHSTPEDGRASSFRDGDRNRLAASLVTAAPTVRGHVVYVNEGSTVRAFDRLSGRIHWVTGIGGGGTSRDGSPAGDLNAIAVVDGHLVTIDGHAYATERSSTARITCLDPISGAVRWATSLDRIDVGADREGAEGVSGFGMPGVGALAPHGAPVILDGLVLTLARKVTPRAEIVSYLVALDLADGSLRWVRHLCSAAGARLSGLRPHTSLAVADGAVFATLSTGAVGRVDARTGEIAWIVRVPVPIRDPRFLNEPWELGAALPTSRGVLTVAPDQRDVLLLDTDTGAEIERHPVEPQAPFDEARYLLSTHSSDGREIVVAVGGDVVAFDATDLTTPLWSLIRRDPARGSDPERRAGVRGRVHVADGVVAIPTANAVLLLDATDGRRLDEIAVAGAGNPVLAGPQLVLATHDAVECYMPFAAAERLIRDRIHLEPAGAEHGLALIGLGLRARSLVTSLDGAEAALASIARRTESPAAALDRDELFRALLQVDAAKLAEAKDDGELLLAMMARVATEPWQRTMHRLVRGDWLVRRGHFAEAATVWQDVLDDAALADASVPIGETRLRGGAAARMRLRELVESYGVEAVAAHAEAAAQELTALLADAPTVADLLSLARRRPMTPAAGEAILSAAALAEEAGEPRSALELLLWAWRDRIGMPSERRTMAEEAVRVAIVARWWRLAHELTATAAVEGLLDAASWTTRIAAAGGGIAPELARLGATADDGRELRGGLVAPAAGCRPLGFRDRVLLSDGLDLVMIDRELSERWRTPLPSPSMELLLADDRGVLVATRAADAVRLTWLDAETGDVRWTGGPLDDLLPPPRQRRGDQPREPGDLAVPLPVGDGVLLLRRDGTAARIALVDGTTVAWRLTSTIRELRAVAVSDAAVVLAGPDASGAGDRVVVVDPDTGVESLRHRPRTGTEVRWIGLAPLGLAMIGTESGVEAIDALGRREDVDVAWSVAAESLRGSLRSWTTSRWLLVADAQERIVALHLSDGRIDAGRFVPPSRADAGGLSVRQIVVTPTGIAAMFDRRVVDFGHDGAVRGMDAAVDDRTQRLLGVGDRLLIPVGLVGGAQVEIAPGVHRTQHDHRVHLLDRAAGLRLLGPPLQVGSVGRPFEHVETIDGWLMLSSGIATIAIPLLDKR